VADLPPFAQERLADPISASSLEDAEAIVALLEAERVPAPTPQPTPPTPATTSPTSSAQGRRGAVPPAEVRR
jgi:protein phosphatase